MCSACVVFLPRLLEEVGASKIIEVMQKNFKITAIRLVRWTSTGAGKFLSARADGSTKKGYIGDKKLIDLMEYDLDRVSLVLGIESDNCLIRIQKLLADGCDVDDNNTNNNNNNNNKNNTGKGGSGGVAFSRSFGGFPAARGTANNNDAELFKLENGLKGGFASRSVKCAQEELKVMFNFLAGEDKIVS